MSKINQARSRLANEVKKSKKTENREAVRLARAELAEAKLRKYIAEVVAQAPALSGDQLARLAALLRPTGSQQ